MRIVKTKALVVDDHHEKRREIAEQLKIAGLTVDDIIPAGSIYEARKVLEREKIDLLVLDICVPAQIDSDAKASSGIEFLREISEFGEAINVPSYIVCITALEDEYNDIEEQLKDNLWQLIRYDKSNTSWKKRLLDAVQYIEKSKRKRDNRSYVYDLLVVCALEDLELGALKTVMGEGEERWIAGSLKYVHYEIKSEGKTIYVAATSQKRMGMVPTSIVATNLINQLTPRYIAMTGICGGYSKYVNLGDIVIADPVWEYQYGKIINIHDTERLQPSVDQYRIDETVLAHLADLARDEYMMFEIEKAAPKPKPKSRLSAHIGPFVTGSAVVASPTYASKITDQTRNIHAIDMEMFGLYAAAHTSLEPRPKVFGIKSVSDFADEHKADDLQEYCAYVSARFLYEFLIRKTFNLF